MEGVTVLCREIKCPIDVILGKQLKAIELGTGALKSGNQLRVPSNVCIDATKERGEGEEEHSR